MKLGAAWYGFGGQTPKNYFEMAAALGLKYVEVPLYALSLDSWYSSREGTEAVRADAQEAGVQIVSGVSALNIAGRLRGKEIDRGGVELGLAQARRAIDIGALLGAAVIRLAEPDRLPPEQSDIEAPYLQAYGDAFHELGDYAAERGVRIAIENFGLTSAQINRVLDVAHHPAVGTLYDPCNYYRHGQDPLAALKDLGGRVIYCHLKDAWFPYPAQKPDALPIASSGQMQPWWWIRPLGKGNLNWGPIFSELATFYRSSLCLEHDIRDTVMWGTRLGIAHVRRIAEERGIAIDI
jgi:sugar phosphate isomerase/epimerase